MGDSGVGKAHEVIQQLQPPPECKEPVWSLDSPAGEFPWEGTVCTPCPSHPGYRLEMALLEQAPSPGLCWP